VSQYDHIIAYPGIFDFKLTSKFPSLFPKKMTWENKLTIFQLSR